MNWHNEINRISLELQISSVDGYNFYIKKMEKTLTELKLYLTAVVYDSSLSIFTKKQQSIFYYINFIFYSVWSLRKKN